SVTGGLVMGDGTDNAVAVLGGTGGNQISDTSVVTFNGQAGATGILRMNNMNETVGGLSSFNGAGIVENAAGVAGTGILTVNIPAGQSQSFSGLLRDGGGTGVDGTLAMVMTGPGTMTLAGST